MLTKVAILAIERTTLLLIRIKMFSITLQKVIKILEKLTEYKHYHSHLKV